MPHMHCLLSPHRAPATASRPGRAAMVLPSRSASALLRASVAAALLLGSGLAVAQQLVVNSDTTGNGGSYDSAVINAKYTSNGDLTIADNLVINSPQGQFINNNSVTLYNMSGAPVLIDNAGVLENTATGSFTLGIATYPVTLKNSGTVSSAGNFDAHFTSFSNDFVPVANSGSFVLQAGANAVNYLGPIQSQGLTNTGTVTLQVTDGLGKLQGYFQNEAGGVLLLDPAVGQVQTFYPWMSVRDLTPTLAGPGEVRKTSAGTTVFTYPMLYTGPTHINAGSLLVNGAGNLATSTSTVASGALLGGDGTAGPSTVQSGGLLSPGSAPVGTTGSVGTLKTAGNASLNGGSITQFELGAPTAAAPAAGVADPAGDLVRVTGNLAMNGVLQIQPGTSLAVGAYKVFTYTGTLTNGASLDTSLAQTNGLTLSIDTSVPGEVWLVAKAAPVMLPQVITYTSPAPTNATVGGTYTATATSNSGLPVTLTSTTPAVCTIANGAVTFVAVGSCALQADQAGDSTHLPASAPQSFNVVAGSTQPPVTPIATPVPTLGHGALALLSLLTAGLAFWRRRSA